MRQIRFLTIMVQLGLLIAGLTAFWIPQGVSFLVNDVKLGSFINQEQWLLHVNNGVQSIDKTFPFIWYGTDWMVFAHILFAVLFIGLYRDPVRNKWLVEFGFIACALIVPLAAIMGYVRGIPPIWQLFDCLFGIIAGIILYKIYTSIRKLERSQLSHSL
ncbi:MAG: hypothetical protein ACI9UJ_001622 [bacterium]|jgi:hypothetical protein